ncbi:MAG: xanthine dehydrogenase family protein molybdopterin-binding subunit [Dehalococcoidia bacterium]|nr:xanthine dehydrogenase family protein molybdopterin-binding subunit [Dehalococcoidia bacterium]
MTDKPNYRVIGTRPVRPDGIDKVTGRAQYGADTRLPGMLRGYVLRSPHAHAKIRGIDTSKAEALPGVKAVMTAADFCAPGQTVDQLPDLSANLMAGTKALYRGHAVAAVAAITDEIARDAAALIEVNYEVLPPVLDVREAMLPGAPILHEAMRSRTPTGPGENPSNIVAHTLSAFGDADAALAECDVVVDIVTSTKMVHQGYIEPQAATATWNPDGQVVIWTCTQGSFPARQNCSQILGHPISKIKVIPTEIGGGFGGKIAVYLEPVAAVLARKTGKPVKLTMDRSDVFEGTGPTPGTSIRATLGATKDGKFKALKADMAYENGAYPGAAATYATMVAAACYDIEHVKIDAFDVVVNKPRTQDYRAPSSPAAAFAIEQLVDKAAEKLGMDPLKLRLANSSHEGSRGPMGMPFSRIGHAECVEAALDSPHYNAPLEGPNRGRGVASGFWFNVGLRSSVNVTVQPDGTVSLVEGSTDIGGTRASLAMQLAETIGVEYEDVKPAVVDTDAVGYNDVTAGSRVTFASGMAVVEAGRNLIKEMTARLATAWNVPADAISFSNGVFSTADGSKTGTFKQIAENVVGRGPGLTVSGSVNAGFLQGGGFAHHIVDVEVDPDTGKVQILRYTAVQDVGTAVHPSYVEGQLQGGAAQGIGWALNEEYYYDETGRMVNAGYLDYRIPTTLDVPMIDTILVEVPNPLHPYGVRGAGEPPIVPPLAAIANAVYRATGQRQTQLPMSPRRILETTGKLG